MEKFCVLFDVCSTLMYQVEAENQEEALKKAYKNFYSADDHSEDVVEEEVLFHGTTVEDDVIERTDAERIWHSAVKEIDDI